MITQTALMSNLADISTHGVKIRQEDRCVSWLPFYHDMGLVGLVLVPVALRGRWIIPAPLISLCDPDNG